MKTYSFQKFVNEGLAAAVRKFKSMKPDGGWTNDSWNDAWNEVLRTTFDFEIDENYGLGETIQEFIMEEFTGRLPECPE